MVDFPITRPTARQAAKMRINPADAGRMHVTEQPQEKFNRTIGRDKYGNIRKYTFDSAGNLLKEHWVKKVNGHYTTILRKYYMTLKSI